MFAAPVTFTAGRWQGAPYVAGGASRPSAGVIDSFRLAGDLDGDGRAEAAALLWSSSGGSGTLLYLAVYANTAGGPQNLDTVLIGDRVQIRAARVDVGLVVLDVVQPGSGDAACCPGETATRRWRLADGTLSELPVETTGRLAVVALEGVEWRLERPGNDPALPRSTGMTLQVAGDRIGGNAGCNDYFGAVRDGASPGEIEISVTGNAGKSCAQDVMSAEALYLANLAAVTNFGFLNGELIMTTRRADAIDTLVFRGDVR